jgi:hypothetical protein
MKPNKRRAWMLAFLLAGLSLVPAMIIAQENIYAEIAGDYNLDLGGRTLPFKIVLKEAKLFFDAGVQGQDPQVMMPVQGKDLTFTSIDPNGDEVVFTFVKEPQGKITECTVYVPSRNAEAKAVKVEKKSAA